MKDVLIISPRFPPANAADAHRVRLSLPYYRAHGWNPIVLTADDPSSSTHDAMLLASIPEDVEVIRVPVRTEEATRRFGFGQLDYRSLIPLLRAGARIIKQRRIPVVLFSTTAFLTFVLGPVWKRLYGCRLVYDLQDPWYHGDALPYTAQTAPGSWRRYKITQQIARRLEPVCMRSADHLISVSPGYVDVLRKRYPSLPADRFTVLPFPASTRDYDLVAREGVIQKIIEHDGRKHWVYAGRGGPDMERALSVLFAHLAYLKQADPALATRLRLHFVGTSYAPAGRSVKTVEPVARRFGVDDLVEEITDRIPYFEALALYRASDVVMLIGSESGDYTASKLFSCVLSNRPILGIFHRDSLVSAVAAQLPCVYMTRFDAETTPDALAADLGVQHRRLESEPFTPCAVDLIAPWLAEASTQAQCEIFERITRA